MGMSARGVALSALVMCLLPLAGACQSNSAQPADLPPLPASSSASTSASPSRSPSVSPSPSPSVTPLSSPTGTDVQQIVALSRDYFAERTKAMNSGDTTRLRSLALPSCPCNKFADAVDQSWREGSIKAPGYYKVHAVTYPRSTSPTTGYSNVIFTFTEEVDFDKSGKVIYRFPAHSKPAGATLTLTRVDGRWRVSDLVVND